MSNRNERLEVQDGEMKTVKTSNSGLIVTPEVIARGRARVAAGEDPNVVAFDVATEELVVRGKLDSPS